jgi:prepilin-type N-terminal cleavage/methylation domain-containing protein
MFDQSTPTYPRQLDSRCVIEVDRGFTLIEMAIVLLIVTLLLGGLLMPLSAQVEQRKIGETQKSLDEIKEALLGFAIANRRLPCPAQSATDGSENAPCNGSLTAAGFIPWAALGVSKTDAWGHIFRYSVTSAFTTTAPFTLGTLRQLTVQTLDKNGNRVNLSNNRDVPVVVLSHGKNGYGAFDDQGNPLAAVPTANVSENTNATSTTTFISRTMTENAGAPEGEFDDIVTWLSRYVLFNRMVAAGQPL